MHLIQSVEWLRLLGLLEFNQSLFISDVITFTDTVDDAGILTIESGVFTARSQIESEVSGDGPSGSLEDSLEEIIVVEADESDCLLQFDRVGEIEVDPLSFLVANEWCLLIFYSVRGDVLAGEKIESTMDPDAEHSVARSFHACGLFVSAHSGHFEVVSFQSGPLSDGVGFEVP